MRFKNLEIKMLGLRYFYNGCINVPSTCKQKRCIIYLIKIAANYLNETFVIYCVF